MFFCPNFKILFLNFREVLYKMADGRQTEDMMVRGVSW